jgi:hypothetical protein
LHSDQSFSGGESVDFVTHSDSAVVCLRIGDEHRLPSPPDSFGDGDQIASEPTAARQPPQGAVSSIKVNKDVHRPPWPRDAALKGTLPRANPAAPRPFDDLAQDLIDDARLVCISRPIQDSVYMNSG